MTNSKPTALVLSGDGINCENETIFALELAGFEADQVHISKILQEPNLLESCSLLVLPGGFSFGDEIASGRVLSIKLMETLKEHIVKFVDSGNLVVGICNGFQALIQMGLLPNTCDISQKVVSLKANKSKNFINKWVSLNVPSEISKAGFFEGLEEIYLPIRHGEGRLAVVKEAQETINSNCALTYSEDVNGSFNQIAALQNDSGNVLGMMPHPEAFIRWTHHPNWTNLKFTQPSLFEDSNQKDKQPDGLRIFNNAREMVAKRG